MERSLSRKSLKYQLLSYSFMPIFITVKPSPFYKTMYHHNILELDAKRDEA